MLKKKLLYFLMNKFLKKKFVNKQNSNGTHSSNLLKSFIKKRSKDEDRSCVKSVPGISRRTDNIKLPKIELKTFYIDQLDYQAFIETFESAVHNSKDISKAEKMNYLINLLECFSLNNSNYDVVLDLLRCKGCLAKSVMPYNSKFPLLLTVDSPITKLVVQQCHLSVAKNGIRETLNCRYI